MREVRKVNESELAALAQIGLDAYPGVSRTLEQALDGLQQSLGSAERHTMGLFEDDILLGGYSHRDFTMTVLDQPVTVGGIGGVAVHMMHKKQRVAYTMLQHFMHHCREHNQPLALLYAFRPDFYRRMGFAYGTPVNQYKIAPAGIVQSKQVAHLRFATPDDSAALLACYNRYTAATNGMIQRNVEHFKGWWSDSALRCVLYAEGESVRGYLRYRFRPAEPYNVLHNNLHVDELIYETPAALSELMTFVGRQADQARASSSAPRTRIFSIFWMIRATTPDAFTKPVPRASPGCRVWWICRGSSVPWPITTLAGRR